MNFRFLPRTFRWRFLLWAFVPLIIGLVALAAYCVHLDRIVTSQFESKRFALPARVYARPLELFVGKPLSFEQLYKELQWLNYQEVDRLTGSAQYALFGNDLIIRTRPFEFWDGLQDGQQVQVTIERGVVTQLLDLTDQQTLDLWRLEPIAMGAIHTRTNIDRQLVRYEQVPRHFVDALIAVEDRRFYYHRGIDARALARAAVSSASGRGLQGGSTITQQLIKNFFLTPDRTLRRKFTEMLMALLVERRYDKNTILETYINEVYFGQDGARAIHGLSLASQLYFGRSVEQLEAHQSALLVAMLRGPTYYHPRRNPERALGRRDLVLQQTFNQGFLAEWQYQEALARPLDLTSGTGLTLAKYPAFMELVRRQLRRDYDEASLSNEGLRIFTTFDPHVQQAAENAMHRQLQALETDRNLGQGWLQGASVVSVPQTGEVLALVGGRQARYQGFNRALDARRPIGSLIKPAVYLTALERPQDYTLVTMLDDSELIWQEPGIPEPWKPSNYDGEFHGPVPLWQGLASSYNVASARLGLELGVANVVANVKRLGIEQPIAPFASVLLGAVELTPIEVAQMYQTLAAGGFRVPLQAVREVLTMEGEPLRRYPLDVSRVVSSETMALVTRAMQLSVSDGTGGALSRYFPENLGLAGKTGTTDGNRDSWFAGFSGDYVAVVWVGNDQNYGMGLTGASGALRVWAQTIAPLNPQPVAVPGSEGLRSVLTHRDTGGLVTSGCDQGVLLPFIAGTEPRSRSRCTPSARSETESNRSWWRSWLD